MQKCAGLNPFVTFALVPLFTYNCTMNGRRRLGNTTNPLIVIQWIIAVATIIGGLYVVSPFLKFSVALNGKSAFLQSAGSDVGLIAFGIVFLISGIIMVAGIVKRKVQWRAIGLAINGLARLYVIIGTFLAVGVLPLSWISNAVVMFIVFYIWGRIRRRGAE